ncbi:MAG: 2-amino-4-hydroxy-6-hydroxymethyldihydropteridine diphosphokinase [Rhodobacterales bacterium 32-66-7]|nr:MAG: 2-amino-4-hydroxy-6-hydroxymethyldihydropteridine diphosphokinase [Rhodobacterales bacterium 12-65-15]OYX25032.1 MAG: 2-amino-4-hydroxy-6-hydroxymethyldihydropteridine diphosphokinase [Rhodobacterales bacterium 32-66-7]
MGANLPHGALAPADTMRAAVAALGEEGFNLQAISRFYATPCFPPGAGPDYVNAAAALTRADAGDVASILAALHRIEARFGRKRAQRWGMRTLDIDLLAVGDLVLPDQATHDHWRALPPEAQVRTTPDRLILPHPRLQDRAFVLVPLADVAPDWCHPRTGATVRAMLAALPNADVAAVTPL